MTRCHGGQGIGETLVFQLVVQHLLARLGQELVLGRVTLQGIEDQADDIDNVVIFPTNSRRGASISYNTDQGKRLRGYVYRQLGIND